MNINIFFQQAIEDLSRVCYKEVYEPDEKGVLIMPYKTWIDEEKSYQAIKKFITNTFKIVTANEVNGKHILTKANLAPRYRGEKEISGENVPNGSKIVSLKNISSDSRYFKTYENSWSNDFERLASLLEDLWGQNQTIKEKYFNKKTNKLKGKFKYFSKEYVELKLILSLRSGINEVRASHSNDITPEKDGTLMEELIRSIQEHFAGTTWIITASPSLPLTFPIIPKGIATISYGEKATPKYLPNEPYGMIESIKESSFGTISSFFVFREGMEDKFHAKDGSSFTGWESIFISSQDASGEIRAIHINEDYSYSCLRSYFRNTLPAAEYKISGKFNIQKWHELRDDYRKALLRIYGIWLEPET